MTRPGQPARCDSVWRRLWRGVRRLRARPDWEVFAGPDWAERIMQVAVTDDFHAKQGRSTGRWILKENGAKLSVYLKRHYQLPWWRGLLAALWPGGGWSPAVAEARNLDWARGEGFPVPSVVASGEYIGPWGRLQSFLAVEELTGMLPLHEAIPAAAEALPPREFQRWKRGLIVELARLVRALHDRRHFHKDLYLCHFFIPRERITHTPRSWKSVVHWIDFHRLARHRLFWRMWQIKDLGQLLYSSAVAGITARDRLRFWRHYAGPGRRSLGKRLLRWFVKMKGRVYTRHNAKKASAA